MLYIVTQTRLIWYNILLIESCDKACIGTNLNHLKIKHLINNGGCRMTKVYKVGVIGLGAIGEDLFNHLVSIHELKLLQYAIM